MAQIPLKSIKFPGLPDTYTVDPGLSEEAKAALLNCIRHIALWDDGNGQQYYDALYDALYNGEVIPTIEYPDLKTGTILVNKYFDASGNITDGDMNYVNEKYFEIDTGETYIWVRGFNSRVIIESSHYTGQTHTYRVCYYDADKNFIERQISDYSDELGYVEQRYFSILPPSNAKYFRVSWGKFPVGNIYRSIPTDLYAVIIVLANLDDSTISNIAELASKFYVTRNNEDITQEVIYGRPDISYQQSSSPKALYHLWDYNVFNINGGGSPEDAEGQNPDTRTRIQSQVSFLMKAGDVIHFNGVKAAVRAEKIVDGTIQHTTAWITDNSDFVIGGE